MSPADSAARTPASPAACSPIPGFERIQRQWDARLQHWCARILPGEYYVTRSAEAVTTVLGSCIAACVRDVRTGVGGMNHFMLPDAESSGESWRELDGTPSARYGEQAMHSLLDALLKWGAGRDDLELKLFGGGRIMPSLTGVGARNIAFARRFAAAEHLRITAEDLGGSVPRQVIFFPASGRALVRRLRALETPRIAEAECRMRDRLGPDLGHGEAPAQRGSGE